VTTKQRRVQLLAQRALEITVVNPPPRKHRSKSKRQRRAWQIPDDGVRYWTGEKISIGDS